MNHDEALERLDWLLKYLDLKNYRVRTLKIMNEWAEDEIPFLWKELEEIRSHLMAQGDIP